MSLGKMVIFATIITTRAILKRKKLAKRIWKG
jgi:hypothetical protein